MSETRVPLTELIREHGFNQTAKDSGLDKPHLWRIATGRVSNPKLATRQKLARTFDVRVNEILFPPTRGEAREL